MERHQHPMPLRRAKGGGRCRRLDPGRPPDPARRSRRSCRVLTLLFVWTGLLAQCEGVLGQPPQRETISGFPARLPILPPSPRKTPEELTEFVESISTNDAMFEVVLGQGRMLTLKHDLSVPGEQVPLIAVGNPRVIDFQLIGPRQLRVLGQLMGRTDLSITTAAGRTYSFEVHVTPDLDILRVQLAEMFPEASLEVSQVRDYVVLKGQARDSVQIGQIVMAVNRYLESVQRTEAGRIRQRGGRRPEGDGLPGPEGEPLPPPADVPGDMPADPAQLEREEVQLDIEAELAPPQVINLLRVPGPQQVLLKVQVAELNRTAMRRMEGAFNFVFNDGTTQIAGDVAGFLGMPINPFTFEPAGLLSGARLFDNGRLDYFITALQRNDVLKILAEPNLIALNGHEASFQVGGRFPIPVPQSGAVVGAVTIQFEDFGVRLNFVPQILDGETVRLTVSPEVSSIDERLGIQVQGFDIPALTTRNATTTVEMKQGQTLAMAGLLQLEVEGTTTRIPWLGDMPILGSLFRRDNMRRVEKELVVLVTPYLVGATDGDCLPFRPGDEVDEPNDLEFYLFGRIESLTTHGFRSTTRTFEPGSPVQLMELEGTYIQGHHGFSP